LIDYQRLEEIGGESYDELRSNYKGWVEEYLEDGGKTRQEEWTGSIAVGSKPFIENLKALLGFLAKGRLPIQARR